MCAGLAECLEEDGGVDRLEEDGGVVRCVEREEPGDMLRSVAPIGARGLRELRPGDADGKGAL